MAKTQIDRRIPRNMRAEYDAAVADARRYLRAGGMDTIERARVLAQLYAARELVSGSKLVALIDLKEEVERR